MKSKPPKRKRVPGPAKGPVVARNVPAHDEQFLVAAVGASAGGIEAFTDLLQNLSPDSGMAFVLIQHLDPTHHSILTEIMGRKTKMPVKEVKDGMRLEPNHVFVIPPNASMTLSDHRLRLSPRVETRGGQMPIDQFMRSLAEGQGNRAIGVILSGSGTDGTLGMAEIQAQGGVTFAQDEKSAKYDGMPRSAINGGSVDYVLPPKGIARELARIAKHPYISRPAPAAKELASEAGPNLHSIFQLLRRSTGVDFTHYRQTTIVRRIQRRMVVHKIEKLPEYVRYVQTNPSEIKALYQDILINVTSFFRNSAVFDALRSGVLPNLVKGRLSTSTIRIWTPGCASGEETYSIAISLLEYLGDRAHEYSIQLFGTDVSESSITKARNGSYPENIQGDVSPERLRRFFTKTEAGYRISKGIRDMCIFARHNVLNDPPFSQMDIICCRNLLIYLEPVLQSKVISLFHYALRPNGNLMLGSSEGVSAVGNLFSTVDRNHKIFSKKTFGARQVAAFSLANQGERAEPGPFRIPQKQTEAGWNHAEAQKEFDRRLLSQYSPPVVFINEDLEIIHSRGNVSRYLKLAPGRASLNILKMAREGLVLELRNAINRAKREGAAVRRQNVQIKNGSGNGDGNDNGHDHTSSKAQAVRLINLEVVPMRVGNIGELYLMIQFDDVPSEPPPTSRSRKQERALREDGRQANRLEQELSATKEYLQSVIETQEATNEELQSANEEILSSNEELQSTNEELETAKEELQSANEELNTVNDELRARHVEVSQINNDLTNLLNSVEVALVIVANDLTIRRFNPKAEKLMSLITSDIGRPLANLNLNVDIANFQKSVLGVVTNHRPSHEQISDREGNTLQLHVVPYKTAEGQMDGAIITLFDGSSPI